MNHPPYFYCQFMKKPGTKSEFIDDRDTELARRVRNLMRERNITFCQAIKLASETPASRFWIDEDRAIRLLRERRNGIGNGPKNRRRRRLLLDLERRVEKLIGDNPDISFYDAVTRAVNSPAPSFYASVRTTYRVLHRQKHL